MALSTGSHGTRLVRPGLRFIALEEHQRYQAVRPLLFDVVRSRRQYEEEYTMSGFGVVPEKSEGARITLTQNLPGYYKSVSQTAYAMELAITRELLMFDLYGIYAPTGTTGKAARAFFHAFDHTRELIAMNVLELGDGTTVLSVGDGGALFANNHPLLGGGTASNLPTGADLDETSLTAALTLLRRLVDDMGKPLLVTPQYLVCSPENEVTAKKLLRSMYEPETGNNAINPIVDWNLRLVISPLLEDTDAWYLWCAARDHTLRWFDAVTPEFRTDGNFENEDSLIKGYMMFSYMAVDWRGVLKNPGA